MTALVVMPTYNEKDNIQKIVEEILKQDPSFEVLVVDDNSPDGTADVVEMLMEGNSRITLLKREKKGGLGSAYRDGFKIALKRPEVDFIFEMDADFSHDPKYLPQFLNMIKTHDMVLGSRYLTGVNVVNWPMSRLLLSYFANIYARTISGLPVSDSTGGFKCFRRKVLETIDLNRISSDGYAFQIEMNYEVWKAGFRIGEFSIVFVDRVEGSSKMNRSIVIEAIFLVWKLRWRSLISRFAGRD